MKSIISICMFLVLVCVFGGCEKNQQRLITTIPTAGTSLVKINYAMPFALNPSVQLKVNGERISNLVTYSTPFPGGGLNTGGGNYADYSSLAAGSATVTISRPNVGTNNDSILLFTGTATLPADKYVTLHVTDTGTNAAMVMVEDDITPVDSGKSRFVFVNLIPGTTLDLYHTSSTTPVATSIPYKGKSPSFLVQAGSSGSWAIRPAGAAQTTTALASYANTIPNQRSMTVYSRGYVTTPATTGTRAPAISLIYNR